MNSDFKTLNDIFGKIDNEIATLNQNVTMSAKKTDSILNSAIEIETDLEVMVKTMENGDVFITKLMERLISEYNQLYLNRSTVQVQLSEQQKVQTELENRINVANASIAEMSQLNGSFISEKSSLEAQNAELKVSLEKANNRTNTVLQTAKDRADVVVNYIGNMQEKITMNDKNLNEIVDKQKVLKRKLGEIQGQNEMFTNKYKEVVLSNDSLKEKLTDLVKEEDVVKRAVSVGKNVTKKMKTRN